MTILVIGTLNDVHVQAVSGHLVKKGAPFTILDPWMEDQKTHITFHLGQSFMDFSVITPDRNIRAAEISAIWMRNKPFYGSYLQAMDVEDRDFIRREWATLFHSLGHIFDHIPQINPRLPELLLNDKPCQLALAKKTGFLLPNTIYTTCPDDALAFQEKNHDIIAKPVSYYVNLKESKTVYTNRVEKEHLVQYSSNIPLVPNCLQQMIEKSYELRVTVIGDRIFAVKIDSQAKQESKTDWRKAIYSLDYKEVELSRDMEDRLRAYHTATGLVYGAYDFIVDKKNEDIYFLEVNPAGQWMWLEESLGIDISGAVADTLIKFAVPERRAA
jgi:glutathione synthase/RimK-type ligase-like ATP-grasp enzyme